MRLLWHTSIKCPYPPSLPPLASLFKIAYLGNTVQFNTPHRKMTVKHSEERKAALTGDAQ